MAFRSIVVFLLALAVAGSVVYLWRRPRPQVAVVEREADIVVPAPEAPSAAVPPVPARPPDRAEVQPALDRVFAGTLVVDRGLEPAFVAGDLNGDDVADLAVAVRPRSAAVLGQLNVALPRWRTLDAQDPSPIGPAKPAPVEIGRTDLLLAVIHGEGAGGWRDPIATQGYLVKNALGSGLAVRPLTEVPNEIRERVIRTHKGDVILETRAGRRGVVFWTGAAYVWADLARPRGTAASAGTP